MWELPVSLGKLGLGPYLTTSIVMSVIAGYAKSQKIMFFEYWRQGGQEVAPVPLHTHTHTHTHKRACATSHIVCRLNA